jgi:hypothetical protein
MNFVSRVNEAACLTLDKYIPLEDSSSVTESYAAKSKTEISRHQYFRLFLL